MESQARAERDRDILDQKLTELALLAKNFAPKPE